MTRKNLAEHETAELNVVVLGRNIQITDAIKEYALKKIAHLERLSNRIIDIQVTIDVQKLEHRVTIIMKVDHTLITVEGRSDNVYPSIDKAIDRLDRKLKKYRSRLQDHHARALSVVDMNVHIIRGGDVIDTDEVNIDIDTANRDNLIDEFRPHEIVARETLPLKTLTYEEAVMQMDLSEAPFQVFRSEVDHKIKVIARRRDGHYSIIEPE